MAEITDLADFEDDTFGESAILDWALSDTGGGLPAVSAHPFADWLNDSFNDFDNESGTQTYEDILKGALDFWTGR